VIGLCASMLSFAQKDEAKIATLTVKPAASSYRIGETPAIVVKITNISDKRICFDESPEGAFKIELYDLEDPSGTDLLKEYRKGDQPVNRRTLSVCAELEPGQSETHTIALSVDHEKLITHPGQYKVMVSRREVENKVILKGNSIDLDIKP